MSTTIIIFVIRTRGAMTKITIFMTRTRGSMTISSLWPGPEAPWPPSSLWPGPGEPWPSSSLWPGPGEPWPSSSLWTGPGEPWPSSSLWPGHGESWPYHLCDHDQGCHLHQEHQLYDSEHVSHNHHYQQFGNQDGERDMTRGATSTIITTFQFKTREITTNIITSFAIGIM